jgi:CRISPR-associated endonuclease/helicase Cas3
MLAEPSALCVVNTKRAARAVYDELLKGGTDGVFHLSTGMCPQHRREKLAEVRRRLGAKMPCYLVSTQLIEAGVDVDFPFLLRELAPLESIIQAAGRCNREGRIPHSGGRVRVFRSLAYQQDPKRFYPPDRWYIAGRGTLETGFLARGVEPQIDDPAAVRDYFSRLYHTGALDGPGIQAMRQKFQFSTVAGDYRLIDNPGEPVVVATWSAYQAEVESLLTELADRPRKALYRRLARFQVNLLPAQRLKSGRMIEERADGLMVWRGKYDEKVGIEDELPDSFIV